MMSMMGSIQLSNCVSIILNFWANFTSRLTWQTRWWGRWSWWAWWAASCGATVSPSSWACELTSPPDSPDRPGCEVDDHDEHDGQHPVEQLLLCQLELVSYNFTSRLTWQTRWWGRWSWWAWWAASSGATASLSAWACELTSLPDSPDKPGGEVDDHDEHDGQHPVEQLLLCQLELVSRLDPVGQTHPADQEYRYTF